MKPKVAFIQKKVSPHGGGEAFALRFVREIEKLGYPVTFLANTIHPDLKKSYDFVRIPMLKPFSFLKALSFAWFCRSVARKKKFEVIVSNERTIYQDIYFAGEGCHRYFLKQRFRQVNPLKRLLIRINPLHWVHPYLERRCVTNPRLKGIIAFSNRTKNEIIEEHGIPEEKIKVVNHGVPEPVTQDLNREKLREEMGIEEDEMVLLFLGSGFERKGLRFLIESLAHFDYPKFRLLVVGRGLTSKYQNIARESGVEKHVHFLGQNPNAPKFYTIADIFVLPTTYEPFGLVVLEAMSYKVPVIVSRDAGASELVTHLKDGMVIEDTFDPKEIASHLNKLRDPDLRKTLAENGFQLSRNNLVDKSTLNMVGAIKEFMEL